MTRATVVLFVVALAAACLFVSLLGAAPWRPVTQDKLGELRVYAYRDWQDTGFSVHPGELLDIQARGEWLYSPVAGLHGPEGHPVFGAPGFYPLPAVPGGALIGRVGETGRPFYVGRRMSRNSAQSGYRWSDSDSGTLYLRIDDDRLGDNDGFVTADVQVVRQQ